MKFSFVLPGYPTRLPVGGFSVIYTFANKLTEFGHEVFVIHPYILGTSRGYSRHKRCRLRNYWRSFQRLRLEYEARTIKWQRFRPDVQRLYLYDSLDASSLPNADAIFATGWQTAEDVFALPREKGVKFHYVADYEQWLYAPPSKKALMKNAFSLPLIKIAMSQVSADMVTTCTDHSAVRVGPLAIDHSVFHPIHPIETRNQYAIAMPYRTPEYKGLSDGLEALRQIKREHPRVHLTLFGASNLAHSLDPWMQYVKSPSNSQVASIYNNVSIFVVPSWAEGWGLPGMEAMACGAALCSTDTGGVREYAKDGFSTLLSPPRKPHILAENIGKLIVDGSLRARIAMNGISTVRQFTWFSATRKLEQTVIEHI